MAHIKPINRSHWILLGCILALGIFFRLWHLGSDPPGLHADEAMTGYTAYSLLQTGKDLAGHQNIVGFADTNIGGTFPSLLSWILVPFIKIFGLHAYVVRLPSAISGILAILLIYLTAQFFFHDRRLSLFAAFFLAVNPWAIHISRQGLLESLSLTLVMGAIFFYVFARNRLVFYVAAFVCFALSLYAYDAPRIFAPFMICCLTIFAWHSIRSMRLAYVSASLIFIFVFMTVIYRIFFLGVIGDYSRSSRLDMDHIAATAAREQTLTTAPKLASRFFHNKATVATKSILTGYAEIFSMNWFFVNGSSNLQRSVGNHGAYYFFEFPLMILGIGYVFSRWPYIGGLLICWLLLGALPGGLSDGNFAYRSSLLLPVPILFSAAGTIVVLQWIAHQSYRFRRISVGIIGFIICFSVTSYGFIYFYDYPVYASEWWATQQNEAVQYVIANKHAYDHVYIYGGPDWMTMYAFWTKLNPNIFHQQYVGRMRTKGGPIYTLDTMTFSLFDELLTASSAADVFPRHSLVIVPGRNTVFAKDVPIYQFMGPEPSNAVFKALEVR